MGAIASRYNKHDDDDDDGSSSKQQHRFASTRRRSSFSSIGRTSSNVNKMTSINRTKKNSSTTNVGSSNTQQATLLSEEKDVTMMQQGNNNGGKRIPLENISNDDGDIMEAEPLPKTRKDKSSSSSLRGRKKSSLLLSPNKGGGSSNLPSFLRGSSSSKTVVSRGEEMTVATTADAVVNAPPSSSKKESNKQPIDPPGAFWNPSAPTTLHGGNHPPSSSSFQPTVGFPMPLWQPPPSHHDDSSSNNNNNNSGARSSSSSSSSSWAVPPFLAPLAATVRHPFSHFVPSGHGHFSYWQQQQQQQGVMNHGEEFGIPMEADEMMEEDEMRRTRSFTTAGDATMNEDDDASVESDAASFASEETKEVDFPSTFAPKECVDKIRAKQAKAANAGQAPHVIQTRSMTAKSRSAKKSSKQKVAPIAAHQASSPPSIKDKVGSGTDTSAVEVMTVLGKTIHVIDPDRKVFVIDLLSPETCDEIRMMADNHTRNAKKDAEVWRTLYTYTKMDLPVVEVKDMVSKYTDQILNDVKKIVGVIFGMRRDAMRLRPRSWKEPHLLLYQALDGKPHHTGIEMHYDGCDVTWQAMLTRQDEYEGGGTYFRSLRKTIRLKQGQVLVHPGELYHKGIDITYGVRCLLVCFTDGMNPKIMDDSRQEDDDPKYEANVLVC